jgi:lipopolysaccharide export system protein LptA
VQQRSAEFTFSKVDGNNTRFILRASHATEFKEGGRTLLEDVWITTFGGNGQRSDQLHTRACEYFAGSGTVTCPDEVLIDLQGNRPEAATPEQDAGADPASRVVHIVTSHLSFNRETGIATSNEPVQFRFPAGEGRAIGLTYDSQRGEIHLLHDVEMVFRTLTGPQPLATATPVPDDPISISGGELFYRRADRLIHLNGAAVMRHGRQELQGGQMTVDLGEDMRAQRLVARDHPVLHTPSGDSDVVLSSDELEAPLGTVGRPERVIASGNVVLSALRADGRHQLTANSSTLDLIPETQQPRHFSASGDVVVVSSLPDSSMRRLQTSQLDVEFVSDGGSGSRIDRATGTAATMEWGNISRGASPSRKGAEAMRVKGQLLDGSFDQAGELRELRGSGGVEIQKRAPGDPAPMISTSRQMVARMASDGQWSTIDQTGDVRLRNASGQAQGDRVRFDRAADSVSLAGSVVLTDDSSQTRAQAATFRQGASELRAEGNVSTTELAKASSGTAAGGKPQPAQISSARLVTDTASGRAVYSGKARLWQADSVIQGDTIELDRGQGTLIATGNVNAVFPRQTQAQGPPAKAGAREAPPSFWRAEAGRMVYEEDQHRARLEQGAHARSSDGSMRADRMDLFFAPAGGGGSGTASAPGRTGFGSSLEGQEVKQAQGFGAVRVDSAGRIGTGERADYSAADGKFVLSGGHPKLIDEFGNSTAGRQLTFLFSDDRIVVDSEEGSRTLTLHRVEK